MFPEQADEYERRMSGALPEGWESCLPTYTPSSKVHLHTPPPPGGAYSLQRFAGVQRLQRWRAVWAQVEATRKYSQMTLEAFVPVVPEFFGGSADLTPS
jgi:transketolase